MHIRMYAHHTHTHTPHTHVQDRWLECELDKKQFLEGFAGFGGGRYQCPGRYMRVFKGLIKFS